MLVPTSVQRLAKKNIWQSSSSSSLPTAALRRLSKTRCVLLASNDPTPPPPTFLIFGSNTDIGKTVLTAALVRAASDVSVDPIGPNSSSSIIHGGRSNQTHYIKPLQSGGSDEAFLRKHVPSDRLSSAKTLFRWVTHASPHTASRIEDHPVSDEQVLAALLGHMETLTNSIDTNTGHRPECRQEKHENVQLDEHVHLETSTTELTQPLTSIWIETAGGVLSPSSSSPLNRGPYHATNRSGWGWVTQADLYLPLRQRSSVILIGDGRLGGISATLSSLEALLTRGYAVSGILMIRPEGEGPYDAHTNREALQEYAHSVAPTVETNYSPLFANPDASIVTLPPLPPEPEPLMEWYATPEVKGLTSFVGDHLLVPWRQRN